jgi:erythronate-4-phosphate dehydrogenase
MSNIIKVIADIDIPFLRGVLEPYVQITYLKGKDINAEAVRDADALIIRTRTRCNASLLENSRVRFIASATIGSDHVDIDYCNEKGIYFTNAAGCNSWGVVQYVISAIFFVSSQLNADPSGKTLGIVGAGNVGERLAQTAVKLGFEVLRCDPPKRETLQKDADYFKTGSASLRGEIGEFYVDRSHLTKADYVSLDELIERSDIVSLHTPLNESTKCMASSDFFRKIKKDAIFINSSRGEVCDEPELVKSGKRLAAIITDVWSNEPEINRDLLNISTIATPHIAGYSLEGKINATRMVVNQLGAFFEIDDLAKFEIEIPLVPSYNFMPDENLSEYENICSLLNIIYPIKNDDKLLRMNPESFEQLRGNYNYRREFTPEFFDLIKLIKNKSHV